MNNKTSIFNKEYLYIFIALLTLLIIPFSSYFLFMVLLFLAIYKGKEWFLKSIIYLVLLRFLNPIFDEINANLFYAALIIFLSIFIIRILKKNKIYINGLEGRFYLLLLLFFITSMLGSYYPDLSLIRLFMYAILSFVVFQSLHIAKDYNFIPFLVRLSSSFILFSGVLLLMPQGYAINGFFMGISNHSQGIGLALVPVLIIYTVYTFENITKYTLFHIFTILLGSFELYLSGSRTAIFSLLGTLVIYYLIQKIRSVKITKKEIISLIAVLFLSVSYYILNADQVNNKTLAFVSKSHDVEYSTKDFSESFSFSGREVLFLVSWENFLKQPWTGIGFNVQTFYFNPGGTVKYIPGTNLIYQKPFEKGNLYISILEEGGIFVGLYFFYIILYLLKKFYVSKNYYGLATFITLLLLFNGEAALFAFGYGVYQLAIIAILFGCSRKKSTLGCR
jgi:hypothetical protein